MDTSSSSELQLFVVDLFSPLLCTLINRPPKYNRSFLQDFLLKFDKRLVPGDFNIHVNWPDNPLVKDILNIIDFFTFTKSVDGSTHEHDITLWTL